MTAMWNHGMLKPLLNSVDCQMFVLQSLRSCLQNLLPVGWFQPIWKRSSQIRKSSPNVDEIFQKIFELPAPSLPPLLLFWSKMLPESWIILTSEMWKLGKSPQDPSPLNKKNMSTPWAISGKKRRKTGRIQKKTISAENLLDVLFGDSWLNQTPICFFDSHASQRSFFFGAGHGIQALTIPSSIARIRFCTGEIRRNLGQRYPIALPSGLAHSILVRGVNL